MGWLLSIDPKTNLVYDDLTYDSWKGIKAFTALVAKHGLEALTVIHHTIDYLSAFSNYKESDRFMRAQEEVYGSRLKLKSDNKLIQDAIAKYSELQYNVDMEQDRIMNEIKINIVQQLSDAGRVSDFAKVKTLNKELQVHNQTLKDFRNGFNKTEVITTSVTANGYTLSRIENDIRSRKKK